VAASPRTSTEGLGDPRVRVTLLGPFNIELGERSAGPWYRPPAKRLCELVMVSPGLRVGREMARELLFADLAPASSAKALSRALSLAREALSALGEKVAGRLRADRDHVWFSGEAPLEVDLVAHEKALRSALALEPGDPRDAALTMALAEHGVLLEDEPYADWALRPREALELVRQRARLELARDRARGRGGSTPETVIEAWESCLAHDPASEEAASSLMRVYSARGQSQAVSVTYERCRAALEALGLQASPALEEAQRATMPLALRSAPAGAGRPPNSLRPPNDERRLVSILFAELSGPQRMGRRLDPEDLREVIGEALAGLIAEVEGLGGTVTAVSGAGVVALFGAPEAHEDDPERAVRAGSRILSTIAAANSARRAEELSVRVGIETGPAVVGSFGTGAGYGAVGEVVGAAAAVQSAAKAGSVLVGPMTRAATEAVFEWGPAEDVVPSPGAKPVVASYLERPTARPASYRGQRPLAGRAPLVGRQTELAVLEDALREAISGTGSVLFIVGEPGLGKTRLVDECRKRFMAWVGASTGRLPLWLEGRAASYASSTPYGLYQQLLCAWVGAAPEEGEEVVRSAMERAMKAVFGAQGDHAAFLAHIVGLSSGPGTDGLARLSPEGLQRATFAAVRALVARLTVRGPTVLLLEDLHWADPISLRLTEELAALTGDGPLFVLLTRRPEPDAGVSGLEGALEANGSCALRKIELSPLAAKAERALAQSLVGPDTGAAVIDTICAGVEGNPLFIEERLSSLVETGALVRDGGIWSLSGRAGTEVPDVLERIIRSRVDRLRPEPRDIIISASVLGREFDLSTVAAMAEVEGGPGPALAELCTTGLLTELRQLPEPVYRFRHALIQEAIYSGMLRSQRRHLHARAAWGLETASAHRLVEVAAVLGLHFAAAGEGDRALHYLEVAADHAASIFANDEAVASYRRALEIVDSAEPGGAMANAAVKLREGLAEVLWRTSRFNEAREVLHKALSLVDRRGSLRVARLQTRLGRVEAENSFMDVSVPARAVQCYKAAVAAFDTAERILGDNLEEMDQEQSDLWLEIQVDGRANLHYWWNEPKAGAEVLRRARPMVESRGSFARKSGFYAQFANLRGRETRYRIDDEMLANARASVAAAHEAANEFAMVTALLVLGFHLLMYGELADARQTLEKAVALSERIGGRRDANYCLSFLTIAALRQHDVEAVRSLAPQLLAGAEAAGYPIFIGAAKAYMAWVAWQDGLNDDVVAKAGEALKLWEGLALPYRFKWVCLWPLISVRLQLGQVAEAVEASHQLLGLAQLRLPDELEALLKLAGAAWDCGYHEETTKTLTDALEMAVRLRYA
jgi:class 3 adenylate cyclase/tetratricopeptide (TPR) repeat protein